MRLLRLGFLATSLAVAAGGGCAKGEAFPGDDCTPNDRKACSCDDGAKGWQLCLKNRSYEPCACSSNNLNEGPPAAPTCGNNRVEPGETCDDGNVNNADGCSALCQRGDGVEASESCAGLRPLPLAAGLELSGRRALVDADDDASATCGGDGGEVVFAFAPAKSGTLSLTLTPEDSSLDVVLYVRGGACGDAGSEVEGGCVNDARAGREERLSVPVEAGVAYFVFAEARQGEGDLRLAVRLDDRAACAGEGEACETGLGGDCASGRLTCFENRYLVCRPDDESCG